MNRYSISLAAMLFSAPAWADTDDNVTLFMENGAAAVVTVPGMTQRECEAAAELLSPRKPTITSTVSGALMLGNGTYSLPLPTTVLSKATCVRPTEGTRP